MSDVQGALCFLTLEYEDWLALQIMPDTAETVWLSRFGTIWLVNADGSTGRKVATAAQGTVNMTGQDGLVVVSGAVLAAANIAYETTADVTLSAAPTPVAARALDPGSVSNLDQGTAMSTGVAGITSVTVIDMSGGADEETDDELRARILRRIRQPPMGGAARDYEAWALAVPGVTRAWCAALEMGMGTVTLRFMCDDLRADNNGFPLPEDISAVEAYLDTVRPVAVKDFFVEAPIPYPVNFRLSYLDSDVPSTRTSIQQSLINEFLVRATPGQLWYRAWTDEGILNAAGVNAYALVASDVPMPAPGYMAVLGDITFG
jgi:uncharacterized phage protein gp47/JayE